MRQASLTTMLVAASMPGPKFHSQQDFALCRVVGSREGFDVFDHTRERVGLVVTQVDVNGQERAPTRCRALAARRPSQC